MMTHALSATCHEGRGSKNVEIGVLVKRMAMRRDWLLFLGFGALFLLDACAITPLAPTPTPAPQATSQPTFTATAVLSTTAPTTATTTITVAVTPSAALTPATELTNTVTVTATPVLTSTPAATSTGAVTTTGGTIATLLAARPEFSTLNSAVNAVQLVEELNGDAPYTLFAPTNAAFAGLPAGTLDALLASPSALASVIQNHLLIEEASTGRLVGLGSVLTTLGQTLPITLTADGIVQLGDATIIEPDLDATNGVIHGIDTVLLPADLVITPTVGITASAATSATAPVTATQPMTTVQAIITSVASTATIADLVQTTPELEMLNTALGAAGLLAPLQLPGQLTLFAPTNAAFEAIPPDQLQTLLNTTGQLAPVLQYHIVADTVLVADLVRLGTALSTSSQPLTITVAADGIVQVNNARIMQADIVATNGVLHLIDAVLMPPQ